MSEEMDTAIQAALAAGDYLRKSFRKLTLEIDRKAKNDFVTEADREAEKRIISILKKKFARYSILAEESGLRDGLETRCWVIDPLDGTTNFIFGYPHFSVSVSLLEAGEPILGVVYDPLRDELFSGQRGKGAFLNGETIRIPPGDTLSEVLMGTGFPFRSREHIDTYLASFKQIFLHSPGLRRDGSAALNISYVAAGRFGGFWELGLSPWDIAAGGLIVEEAGGILSDFVGGRDYLNGGDVIAAPPGVHEEILRIVKSVFKGKRPGIL